MMFSRVHSNARLVSIVSIINNWSMVGHSIRAFTGLAKPFYSYNLSLNFLRFVAKIRFIWLLATGMSDMYRKQSVMYVA